MQKILQSQTYTELMNHLQNLISMPAFRRTIRTMGTSFGFTIVELLIVVVVIGVISSIVVVAYRGITSNANKTSVLNDLASLGKKLELYKVTNGKYPTDATGMNTADLKVSRDSYDERNNLYYVVDTGGRWYTFGAITQNVAHCLANGRIIQNGGNACNSYANTLNNVIAQANSEGVTITSANTWNSSGYDWPGDGAGSGWATWMH